MIDALDAFVLVILLAGAADGGRAIDTTQSFRTLQFCQRAADAIAVASQNTQRFPPTLVCIQKKF